METFHLDYGYQLVGGLPWLTVHPPPPPDQYHPGMGFVGRKVRVMTHDVNIALTHMNTSFWDNFSQKLLKPHTFRDYVIKKCFLRQKSQTLHKYTLGDKDGKRV